MDRKTRVLIVANSLAGGGAERVTATLATHFDPDRYEIGICILSDDAVYEIPKHVSLYKMGYSAKRHLPRTILRLRRTIRQFSPDIVLSMINWATIVTWLALKGSSKPASWIARLGSNPHFDSRFFKRFGTRIFNDCDHIIANCEEIIDLVHTVYPNASTPISAIGNPVDIHAIDCGESGCPKRDGPAVILYAGRLIDRKRVDLLIDAFAALPQRDEAELWICGDGPMKSPLLAQVAALGLETRVKFLPFQNDLKQVMCQARLLVLTSDYEGLPNVLIEAQALGLPVVSTRCPTGPSAIIEEGRTGFLVPVGDATAVSQAIARILSDDRLWTEMSAAAKVRSKTLFAAEVICKQYEQLFQRCLGSTIEG